MLKFWIAYAGIFLLLRELQSPKKCTSIIKVSLQSEEICLQASRTAGHAWGTRPDQALSVCSSKPVSVSNTLNLGSQHSQVSLLHLHFFSLTSQFPFLVTHLFSLGQICRPDCVTKKPHFLMFWWQGGVVGGKLGSIMHGATTLRSTVWGWTEWGCLFFCVWTQVYPSWHLEAVYSCT